MKKRHEQKLVIVSLVLFLVFNLPFVLIFNQMGDFLGFPILYFVIFFIWLIAAIVSLIILYRHYE